MELPELLSERPWLLALVMGLAAALLVLLIGHLLSLAWRLLRALRGWTRWRSWIPKPRKPPLRLETIAKPPEAAEAMTVETIIRALKDKDVEVRRKAAAELGALGSALAIPELMNCLKDQEGSVRSAAAEGLGKLGAAAVQPLVDSLEDADPGFRLLAIDALGQIGLPAISPLEETLRSRDPRLREAAAAALANIPEEQSAEALLAGLSELEPGFREKVMQGLVKIGKPAVPALLEASLGPETDTPKLEGAAWDPLAGPHVRSPKLSTESAAMKERPVQLDELGSRIRTGALWALAKIGDDRAVPRLLSALGETNSQAREAAREGLTRIGAAAVEPLLGLLRQGSPGQQSQAAHVLGSIGDARAVEPLLKALSGPEAEVRNAAAAALGQMKEPRAVDRLAEALRDAQSEVRSSAVAALRQIGTPSSAAALQSVLEHEDASTRLRAAAALAALGKEQGVAFLVNAFEAHEPMRETAALALAQAAPARAVNLLVRLARQKPSASQTALDALVGALEAAATDVPAEALQAVFELPLQPPLSEHPGQALQWMVKRSEACQLAANELGRRSLVTVSAEG